MRLVALQEPCFLWRRAIGALAADRIGDTTATKKAAPARRPDA